PPSRWKRSPRSAGAGSRAVLRLGRTQAVEPAVDRGPHLREHQRLHISVVPIDLSIKSRVVVSMYGAERRRDHQVAIGVDPHDGGTLADLADTIELPLGRNVLEAFVRDAHDGDPTVR